MIRHMLAYGNSDQASFRREEVRHCFDFMTVPGTIAAYYADATAGFVLSSQLDYFIDPRTPLFQGYIDVPRASHYALAAWLGPTVEAVIGNQDVGGSANFTSDIYSGDVVQEVTESLISAQRGYGARSQDVQERIDRYAALLAEAIPGETLTGADGDVRSPSFILAPYFAAERLGDEWWQVTQRIWSSCQSIDPSGISPVVAVGDTRLLSEAVSAVPSYMSPRVFFWITGLDERKASESELIELQRAIRTHSQSKSLVNLYGGFFSICLSKDGLWGFNNGLGYSESRDWPELPATGATPPRYYIPRLHLFTTRARAQAILDAEPALRCSCAACVPFNSGTVANMEYSELKRHFALARRDEIQLVESLDRAALASELQGVSDLVESQLPGKVPSRLVPNVRFLRTWADVLRSSDDS